MQTLSSLSHRRRKGFTLIELLIVIAIILILIAIALPNFLEAQIRARVTKVKGEFRSLETALTAYFNDWAWHYPMNLGPNLHETFWPAAQIEFYTSLTTPNAYITDVNFVDPFIGTGVFPSWYTPTGPDDYAFRSYYFVNYESWFDTELNPSMAPFISEEQERVLKIPAFVLSSYGPNTDDDEGQFIPRNYLFASVGGPPDQAVLEDCSGRVYAPTNGTKSRGDIVKFGGMFPAQVMEWSR